jgi:beta-glucosidase
MGTSFMKGLQGSDPFILKASACAKHFAVHSGPEASRHEMDVQVDEKDLRETYLYAFKKMVDAGVESVMCAYNRVNGEPCCTGTTLLQKILRTEWGFKGHVVTDCWALEDVWSRHKALPGSVETAAAAIKAGVNLDCSNLLQDDVMKAIERNLLTEKEVDSALAGILRTELKLGFFDAASLNPYRNYGADSISNTYHIALSKKMATGGMVLLKNDRNLLPLNINQYNSYMVIGPTAASTDALMGNYHGLSSKAVNFAEGITAAVNEGTRVEYDQGCDFTDTVHFGGIWASGNAAMTIAVIGFTPVYEGEEGDAFLAAGGGDRKSLSLPASQIAFMKALRKGTNHPIIAVITAGSAVDVTAITAYADAIIYAWYPGEQGGNALADLIFGKVSPSGRLPVSFYQSFDDLPAYTDYKMKGRTYRYFQGRMQYPFGYGLSYTSFDYTWLKQPKADITLKDSISFSIKIKNTGNYDGEEVVQAYIEYPNLERMPVKELKAFKKAAIRKGEESIITITIPVTELKKWDLLHQEWKLYAGEYHLCLAKNAAENILTAKFKVR